MPFNKRNNKRIVPCEAPWNDGCIGPWSLPKGRGDGLVGISMCAKGGSPFFKMISHSTSLACKGQHVFVFCFAVHRVQRALEYGLSRKYGSSMRWQRVFHEKGWAKERNAASKGDMGDDHRNQPSKIAIVGIIHRQFLGQVDRANEDLIPCGILVMH